MPPRAGHPAHNGDIVFPSAIGSVRSWWKLVVARQIVCNLKPTGFAADKDWHSGRTPGSSSRVPSAIPKLVESLGIAGNQPRIRLGSI
jgi:hypothetical protein